MFFLKTSYFLKKAKIYSKKYWKYLLLGSVVCFVYLVNKKKLKDSIGMFNKNAEESDKKIKEIETLHKKEIADIKDAEKNRKKTIEKIERKFKEKNRDLDDYKRMQIEKILSETNEHPDVITKRLSKITGFKIDE